MVRSLRNIASGALFTVLFFSCSEVADHKISSTAVEEGVVFEKDGETYFHIIDLKDGFPARNGLISATVISEDGTLADALSTTLFILGPKKAGDYWRNHADQFQAVLMEDDGTILITEGLEDTFESDAPFEVIRQ